MKHRAEIDGLRAVAVLPVILFHAGFDRFGGGFVGVDVFFVISGYLITSIILAEKERGTFSLAGFYNRRARRILPALLFVICVTLPFAWFLLVPSGMKEYAASVRYISIFGSNFLFAREAGGYFATAAELKPLLHTWSLAVEEQFYLVFPVFLLLVWRLDHRRLAYLLAAIALASFAFALWGSANRPAETFYLPYGRAWELLFGGLIALVMARGAVAERIAAIGAPVRELAGLAGLALIAYGVFAFDKTTPYPGFYALAPTLGAGLVIVFSTAQTFVARLLSMRWVVGAGLVSYSAYLWHQPLFAFARLYSNGEPAALFFVALIVSSFILAYLTWRFVEQPFRSTKTVTRSFFVAAGSISAALFAFGFVFSKHDRLFERGIAAPARFTASLAYPRLPPCDVVPVGHGIDTHFCLVGDRAAPTTVALFGDSHSQVLLSTFDEVARPLRQRVVHVTLGGCPGFIGIHVLRHNPSCPELAQRQFEYVRDNKIRTVFLVSRWTLYTDGDYDGKNLFHLGTERGSRPDKATSRAAFLEGFERTVEAYRSIGARLYVVTQVPQQLYRPEQVYYQLFYGSAGPERIAETVRKMAVPAERHLALQRFSRDVFARTAAAGRITLIDFDAVFCDRERCPFGNADETFYHDTDHLSGVGASMLRGRIAELLAAAAAD